MACRHSQRLEKRAGEIRLTPKQIENRSKRNILTQSPGSAREELWGNGGGSLGVFMNDPFCGCYKRHGKCSLKSDDEGDSVEGGLGVKVRT